jgi:hypothetical protein
MAIKNKWSTGWMKAWFYYKVLVNVCSQGGKSMHALCLHMSGGLSYQDTFQLC